MALLRNFATVGAATLSSRALGFVRDVLIAAALGTGPIADAFFVAFRFPNLFRRLFAEGAFNSAFVPLFSKALTADGPEPARRFAGDAAAGLISIIIGLTLIIEAAMPLFILLIASGFSGDPEKFDLTVLLSRIAFPYLALVSLLALLSGVLNGLDRFAAAAFAPTMLNVVLIAVLAGILGAGLAEDRDAGIWLAVGVVIGGFAQLALVFWELRRVGFSIPIRRPRWTPEMARLVRLGIPGVLAGGVTQINIVIGTIIASYQAGAVSYLYFADRIYQLPLGVVGIAIGVVLLPELSRQLAGADPTVAEHTQNRALEFAMALTLPAALALIAIPGLVVSVLFERGAFTTADTAATAVALQAFALGLPAFVLIKVFSPGFFAREDTATPMRFAALGVAVNIAGSLLLFPFIGHVGIAIATTLAGWVNAGLLGATLYRRGLWRTDGKVARRLPRMALASLAMAIALFGLASVTAPWMTADGPIVLRLAVLSLLVGLGVVLFFGIGHLIGGLDLREIRRLIRRRGGAAPT